MPYDFAVLPYTIEKWTHTAMMVIRFAMRAAFLTLIGVGIAAVVALLNQQALVADTLE